jgi:hypothetical protein
MQVIFHSQLVSCEPAGYPVPDPTRSRVPGKIRRFDSGPGLKKEPVRVRVQKLVPVQDSTPNLSFHYQSIFFLEN